MFLFMYALRANLHVPVSLWTWWRKGCCLCQWRMMHAYPGRSRELANYLTIRWDLDTLETGDVDGRGDGTKWAASGRRCFRLFLGVEAAKSGPVVIIEIDSQSSAAKW